jgi:hypothetical protein
MKEVYQTTGKLNSYIEGLDMANQMVAGSRRFTLKLHSISSPFMLLKSVVSMVNSHASASFTLYTGLRLGNCPYQIIFVKKNLGWSGRV